MRFEKISAQQIKCTITYEDLESRHIKLSDLAYGNEKTKRLFAEMMAQAKDELGFEAGTVPLAIEAIPMANNNIVLIISKVEFPEELDVDFSRFTEFMESLSENDSSDDGNTSKSGGNSVFDFLNDIKKHVNNSASEIEQSGTVTIDGKQIPINITKMYGFNSLKDAIFASKALYGFYNEENSLYKTNLNTYLLVVQKGDSNPEDFTKVSNILSEYSNQLPYFIGQEAYFKEQFKTLISNNAIETLAQM